jgi:hypothetical protein
MRALTAGTIAVAACLLFCGSAFADALDPKSIGQQDWEISFKLILDNGKHVPFVLRLTSDGGLTNTVISDTPAWRIDRKDAGRILKAVCQYLNTQQLHVTTNDQMRIRLGAGNRSFLHSAPPGPLPPLLRTALDVILSADPQLKDYVNDQIPKTTKP